METNIYENAYEIGENMVILHKEGKSVRIANKETGAVRQFVAPDGRLTVDDEYFDFEAIRKGCPHFCRSNMFVRYGFGRYDDFKDGICAFNWTVYPDGCYFRDSDGYGGDDNDEENAWCIVNRDLDIIMPFQPVEDIQKVLRQMREERRGGV